LKLCELDCWNGTVLNVAHCMIPVCMEFMDVLLQRPACIFRIIPIISGITKFACFCTFQNYQGGPHPTTLEPFTDSENVSIFQSYLTGKGSLIRFMQAAKKNTVPLCCPQAPKQKIGKGGRSTVQRPFISRDYHISADNRQVCCLLNMLMTIQLFIWPRGIAARWFWLPNH
jgi:hypothetical protein